MILLLDILSLVCSSKAAIQTGNYGIWNAYVLLMMYMYAPQKKGIVEFMQYLLIDFFAIEGQDLASDGLDLEMTSKFIAKKSQE